MEDHQRCCCSIRCYLLAHCCCCSILLPTVVVVVVGVVAEGIGCRLYCCMDGLEVCFDT